MDELQDIVFEPIYSAPIQPHTTSTYINPSSLTLTINEDNNNDITYSILSLICSIFNMFYD